MKFTEKAKNYINSIEFADERENIHPLTYHIKPPKVMPILTSDFPKLRYLLACGAFSLGALFIGQTANAQSTWYFDSDSGGTFDLNSLSNWYADPGGVGGNPPSFDANHTWLWNERAFTSGTFPVSLTTGGISAELDARDQNHVYANVTAADGGRLNVYTRREDANNNTITINQLDLTATANTTVAARFLTTGTRSYGRADTAGTGINIGTLTGSGDIWFGDGSTDSSSNYFVNIGDASAFTGHMRIRQNTFILRNDLELAGSISIVNESGLNFQGFNIATPVFMLGTTSLDEGTYSVLQLNDLATAGGNDVTFSGTGQLTVVPEPATYAVLFGALALGLVLIRRKCFN